MKQNIAMYHCTPLLASISLQREFSCTDFNLPLQVPVSQWAILFRCGFTCSLRLPKLFRRHTIVVNRCIKAVIIFRMFITEITGARLPVFIMPHPRHIRNHGSLSRGCSGPSRRFVIQSARRRDNRYTKKGPLFQDIWRQPGSTGFIRRWNSSSAQSAEQIVHTLAVLFSSNCVGGRQIGVRLLYGALFKLCARIKANSFVSLCGFLIKFG